MLATYPAGRVYHKLNNSIFYSLDSATSVEGARGSGPASGSGAARASGSKSKGGKCYTYEMHKNMNTKTLAHKHKPKEILSIYLYIGLQMTPTGRPREELPSIGKILSELWPLPFKAPKK